MPLPSDFKNVSAEMRYIQPVMTSNTTWSNNPSFGMEVHRYGQFGTNTDNADTDWGTRKTWYAFSGNPLGTPKNHFQYSPFIHCHKSENDYHTKELRLQFPCPLKMKSFSHQQIKDSQTTITTNLTIGEEIFVTQTVPNKETSQDLTYHIYEVPEEKQIPSDTWSLKGKSAQNQWAQGNLWIGNNCKIDATYNPTHIVRNTGVFEKDYDILSGISSSGNTNTTKNFFIDTGVKMGSTVKMEMDFTPLSSTVSCGCVSQYGGTSSSSQAFYMGVSSGNAYYGFYDYSSKTTTFVCGTGQRHIMSLDALNSIFSVNGQEIVPTHTLSSFNNNRRSTITIFGRSDRAGFGDMILHGFKIWENGELIRDYIPVRRRFDGINGLYDKKTKSFIKNTGTNNFIPHELS